MAGVVVADVGPERLDDWLKLFDGEAFCDNPKWASCYCWFHFFPGDQEGWKCRDGAANRAAASTAIRAGRFPGHLAYLDGAPVGWCQALDRRMLPSPERFAPLPPGQGETVGCVLCFVVATRDRGQGVATALLDAACQRLATQGLWTVLAYPIVGAEGAAANYHGPLDLYLKAGFVEVGAEGPRRIVRRDLRGVGRHATLPG